MDLPGTASALAPGMEEVIEAGNTLEITDSNGQVFAVTAKECEETMAFLTAFDEWLSLKDKQNVGAATNSGIDAALFSNVKATFRALPMRVQRDLPSFKRLGISVPTGHSHS